MTALPSTLLHTLNTHTGPINAITFSSLGGTYILTGSSDRQIHLSRTEPSTSKATTTTSPIQTYSSHGYPVLSLAVSSSNTHFASSGGDRAVFFWDVSAPFPTSPLRRFGSNTSQSHTSKINSVVFAGQDDSVLISGGDDTTIRLWDVKSKDPKPLMVWDEAKDSVSCVAVPQSTPWEVTSGSVDGRVRTYDLRMGKIVVDVMAGAVTNIDLSRDGKIMLVGTLDGRVRLFDRRDGTCLRTFPIKEGADGYKNENLRLKSCLAMNDALVLSGSEADGNVRGWDVLSGEKVGEIEQNTAGKVVSVVTWREGSQAEGRRGLFAAGGAAGAVSVYGT